MFLFWQNKWRSVRGEHLNVIWQSFHVTTGQNTQSHKHHQLNPSTNNMTVGGNKFYSSNKSYPNFIQVYQMIYHVRGVRTCDTFELEVIGVLKYIVLSNRNKAFNLQITLITTDQLSIARNLNFCISELALCRIECFWFLI